MMKYVLGIDGGGTKTLAAIVDERGDVCGLGQSGPSNYDDIGVDQAREHVRQAVEHARREADLTSASFDAAFFGMAGVVSDKDHRIVTELAHSLDVAAPERVGVHHDCRIALAGGLSGRPGMVLIAGTGSACYGRTAEGQDWLAGGWGHLLADEGSGYWLGLQAMRMAVQAYDGRSAKTSLLERCIEALDLGDITEIMHHIYVHGMSRSEIASLAPIVIDAAREGDGGAVALVHDSAASLARCVEAVARRLGLNSGPSELTLVGGLFSAADIFVLPLKQAVLKRLNECRITAPELPPVLGACLLALQSLGVDPEDELRKSFRRSELRADLV